MRLLGKCKNCKFWDSPDQSMGVCAYSSGWDKEYGWNMRPNEFEVDATANDDSGLNCELVTGPDFGCVLFLEAKKGF